MVNDESRTIAPHHPRSRTSIRTVVWTALLFISMGWGLTACGSENTASDSAAQRIEAAKATAESGTNHCADIRPFYWEVGDKGSALVSGSVGGSTYTADTVVPIASASKWLYSSYVAEKKAGVLHPTDDVKFLNFLSGYTNLSASCLPNHTVNDCLNSNSSGSQSAATVDHFFYNNGHMQKHASLISIDLGAADNAALAKAIMSELGTDLDLSFSRPEPAAGGVTSARGYARFLRKLLSGDLQMSTLLGTRAVCTNPATCPTALFTILPSPAPSWHYSLGHWVEDEPTTGDGAFSSIGSQGFYPWIDASRTSYGVIARNDGSNWFQSAQCGRLIRKAWVTGVAQ